jgi:hypothetical protein
MSRGPLGHGKNWVSDAGGLPPILRGVTRHLMAQGYDESRAIATAVNWAKKMCATGRAFGGRVEVGADARAQACAAVARWEAMKAAALAKPNKDLTAGADCGCTTVDLSFTEQLHPRAPKGTPQGGKFKAKTGSGKGGPPGGVAKQIRDFQRRHGLPVTGRFDRATMAQIHRSRKAKGGGGGKAKAAAANAALDRQDAAEKARVAAALKAASDVLHGKFGGTRTPTSGGGTTAHTVKTGPSKAAKALATAVNNLAPAQRAQWLRTHSIPGGYALVGDRLVPAAVGRARVKAILGRQR